MQIKGGFARGNSVTFLSENFTATAKRNNEGEITVETKRRPFTNSRNRYYMFLSKLPFFRSFISLMTVLFQSTPVAIVVGLAVIVSVIPGDVLNNTLQRYLDLMVSAGSIMVVSLTFYKFGSVKKYHGAEHKVANAYSQHGDVTLASARNADRRHERCGTNYLTVIIFIAVIVQLIARWEFDYSLAAGMAVAGEVARLKNNKIKKPFLLLGGFLQTYVFTAEPGDRELEVAIAAVRGLQEQEKLVYDTISIN